MVVEKMKLQILHAISVDLAKHVDSVFDDMATQKERKVNLEDVVEHYITTFNKPRSHIGSTRRMMDVVETKRDISFIFYCICCPFFYNLGVNERFSKDQSRALQSMLNIKSRMKLSDYIISAKHYYRIYSDFREKIDNCVNTHIKKE